MTKKRSREEIGPYGCGHIIPSPHSLPHSLRDSVANERSERETDPLRE